jgi:archaellum component FlaC
MIGESQSFQARNGGLTECAGQKVRTPEIQIEMSRLQESVDILEKYLGEHAQKIAPVCRNVPASPTTPAVEQEGRTSSLGSSLQSLRNKIERISNGVSTLTSLVEV